MLGACRQDSLQKKRAKRSTGGLQNGKAADSGMGMREYVEQKESEKA